jgi:hypothetical protein
MNAPFPFERDLLAQAVERTRRMLADAPSNERVVVLWAAARAARHLGATDVVARAFVELAVEVNLIDRHGRADIEHIVAWAVRGLNPFEPGATLQ